MTKFILIAHVMRITNDKFPPHLQLTKSERRKFVYIWLKYI